MDELPADDDLLSCMLLEYVRRCFSPSTLEFEPAITTHKMNPHQRAARFDREAVSVLVRQHVIWERDLSAALAAFLQYVARVLTQNTSGPQTRTKQDTCADARL